MRIHRLRPVSAPPSAFAGFRFPPDVIVLAVRWYLRFGLSYRDVVELLAERGVEVDHVTIYRWVQRFTPLLADAARPCRHAVGTRWHVDETYVKVAGRWRYVYRAVDQFGQVIDVFVSPRRDATAARRFFQQAIKTTKVTPAEVTTDQAATYPIVLDEVVPAAWHRTEQYTNNPIEADHGRLKHGCDRCGVSSRTAAPGPSSPGMPLCRTSSAEVTTNWQLRRRPTGEWRLRSVSWSWLSERRRWSGSQPALERQTQQRPATPRVRAASWEEKRRKTRHTRPGYPSPAEAAFPQVRIGVAGPGFEPV